MKVPTKADVKTLPKVRLPSRGGWITARAAYYREAGKRSLDAIREAAADWDEGRPVGNWDFTRFSGASRKQAA